MNLKIQIPAIFICFCAILSMVLLPFTAASAPTSQAVTDTAPPVEDHAIRFLVMGCDNSGKLTDSILVVAVEKGSGAVNLLQIPRDTYANYAHRDYKKINGAWSLLGNDECGLSAPARRAHGSFLFCIFLAVTCGI